jgi:flagellin-specific chaperone FliS
MVKAHELVLLAMNTDNEQNKVTKLQNRTDIFTALHDSLNNAPKSQLEYNLTD